MKVGVGFTSKVASVLAAGTVLTSRLSVTTRGAGVFASFVAAGGFTSSGAGVVGLVGVTNVLLPAVEVGVVNVLLPEDGAEVVDEGVWGVAGLFA